MRHYHIMPPSPHLSGYVRYFWTLNVHLQPGDRFSMKSYVDDSCGIAFLVGKARHAISWNETIIPPGIVYGLTTGFHSLESFRSFSVFGVVFHSHALYSIFGLAPAHFSDKAINLADAVDKYITEQIQEAPDTPSRIRIMESFLLQRLIRSGQCSKYIRSLCKYIFEKKGILGVQDLEKTFGIHIRQLERKFREQIGVSPVHYIKIARFQEALKLMKAAEPSKLTEIAYELEFSDQSHFIKQVRRFSGLTPRELRKHKESIINLIMEPGGETIGQGVPKEEAALASL